MAAPSAAHIGESWPQHREREIIELVELTGGASGSVATDSVAYTGRYGRIPLCALGGGVSYTISGAAITLILQAALGDGAKIAVEVVFVPGAN